MYLIIIAKTIVLYVLIVLIDRMIDKKEVGKLTMIEFLVSLLIVELFFFMFITNDRFLWMLLIPIAILIILQFLFHYGMEHNRRLRNWIDRKPTVIIKDGTLNFKEMASLHYSFDQLLSDLHEQGYHSIEEVPCAILKTNGKLSILRNTHDQPLPLIVDGHIDQEKIQEIRKDVSWLMNVLKKKQIDLKEVFYAFYTNQKVYIIKKEKT